MFIRSEIKEILQIAKDAGDLIMQYYHDQKPLLVTNKDDNSPVTRADLAANDLITQRLNQTFPNIAIVSEENQEQENINAAKENQYFMIDPLDGTSSFISKSDEFSVNIALIKNSKPAFGAIYVPAKDLIYFTNENSKSIKISNFSDPSRSQSLEIKTSNNTNDLKIICTKREPERSEVIKEIQSRNISISEVISVSSSYKFCLIAQGLADLYPRRVNIKAWDVAAGHAIVNGAGGVMIDLTTNQELQYCLASNFEIPFFEASSRKY